MQKSVLLALLLGCVNLFAADTYSISGVITDAESNPLPGAHVFVNGTSRGAASSSDGTFIIRNLPPGNYTLNISYSGYGTEHNKIELPLSAPLTIVLKPVIYNINQIVITGTKNPKPLKESPVLTQLISSSKLAASGNMEIMSALENSVPGIEFSHGAYGSNVSMMGLSGNYVLFLKDGNRLAGENNGNIDYHRLSLINADRIEIVRGASSVLYGSNAMAGVVNIITEPQIEDFSFDLLSRQTAFNTNLTEISAGIKNGELTSRTSYKYDHTDGYDLNDKPSDGRTMEKTTTHKWSQLFRWTPSHSFEMEASGSAYKNHVDASLPLRNNKLNDNLDMVIKAKYHINRNSTLEAVWHQDNYRIFEKDGHNTELQYDNIFQNARLAGNIKIGDHSRLTAGAEYLNEGLTAPRNKINERIYNDDWIGYLQQEAKITKWMTLTAGLRMNYNSDYGNHATWQSSAMIKKEYLSIRANLGTGYRAPTLKERNMEYQAPTSFPIFVFGNPELQPETSIYAGLSTEFSFDKLNFSFNIYQNSVDEMILEVMEPYNPAESPAMIYYYQNIEEVKIRGLDFLFLWKPLPALIASGGYGLIHAEDQKKDRQLTGSRKHSGNINLNYKFDARFSPALNMQANYYGKMSRSIYDQFSGEETISQLDDYSIWKVLGSLNPLEQLTIQLGVDNIFNFTDKETFASFSPGRTVFVSVRLAI